MQTQIGKSLLKIGRWDVSPTELRVSNGDTEHTVEAKVMDVLIMLAEHAGEVVSREAFIEQVWGTEAGGDESLTRAISLLRKALGDTASDAKHIRTIPRKGYQLIAPVTVVDAAPASISAAKETVSAAGAALPSAETRSGPSRNGMIALVTAALLLAVALINFGRDIVFPAPAEPPLVMVMDSAHPARIYDDAVRESGGTNADILSDILSDLQVRTQKELISPNWHRHEAIRKFEPDLIVIHYSGFKQEDARGPRPQLKLLMEYFADTETDFLIYSRASQEWLSGKVGVILEELSGQHPGLTERVEVFALYAHGEPLWQDPNTAQALKLKIRDILALE